MKKSFIRSASQLTWLLEFPGFFIRKKSKNESVIDIKKKNAADIITICLKRTTREMDVTPSVEDPVGRFKRTKRRK